MELSGNLSDFALTDILQILALSRKSGTLALESGGSAGVIVIERGRITYASMTPGETLSNRLVREGKVSPGVMERLRQIGEQEPGVWTLKALLLESGVIAHEVLEESARRHIHEVVGGLVHLEKGRFGIELNQTQLLKPLEDVGVLDGLDVGEVLLGAAKELDEDSNEGSAEDSNNSHHDFAQPNYSAVVAAVSGNGNEAAAANAVSSIEDGMSRYSETVEKIADQRDLRQSQRAALLFSMLAELRSHSFEAEVSLLIMRYASEVAARGILFVVKDGEICGLGQFGVAAGGLGKSPDERVREIRIPIGAKTIFDMVVNEGQPYIGNVPDNYWHAEMLKKIGGNGMPLEVFALPLVCNDQPIFVFYGDNFPGRSELTGIDELVALVNQASIVLEKIVLERMLDEIRQSR